VEVATARRHHPLFEGLPVDALWDAEGLADSGRFDRVIDLQSNVTSRRLLQGLGPARRYRSRSLERRWTVAWGTRPPRPRIPHAVERYAEAAGCDGEELAVLRPRLVITERDRDAGVRFAAAWGAAGDSCVGLVEGASRRMKRWPEERFARLAGDLATRGIRTLRFLDPADGMAAGHALDEGETVTDDGCVLVRASLRPLKALLGRCRAVVTNDSGIMHVAVGLGVPVVAIFGATVLELGFGPIGRRDVVLQRDLPCRPCGVHGARRCWMGHGRCMREIASDEVLRSVLAVMEGNG
jgi:ADP-heptose:LPS heptosyltransferase